MRPYVFVLQCVVLAIGVGFSSALAQDSNLLTAAKREGRVVWYSSVGESQQFAQEFEKKYPFHQSRRGARHSVPAIESDSQ